MRSLGRVGTIQMSKGRGILKVEANATCVVRKLEHYISSEERIV